MREKSARRLRLQQHNDEIVVETPTLEDGAEMLSRQRLDAFHPCAPLEEPLRFCRALQLPRVALQRAALRLGEGAVRSFTRGIRGDLLAGHPGWRDRERNRFLHRLSEEHAEPRRERLISLGYVARHTDGDDRRSQILTLAPAGRAVFDEALPRFAGLEQEMLAPLSLVEREMLAMLLAKVVLAMFHAESDDEDGNLQPVEEM